MRTSVFLGIFLAAFSSTRADELPMFRPALIGTAPDAIINRINEKQLLASGQKDAAVMFSCAVDESGKVLSSATYRGTPGSKPLEEEVLRCLTEAKMVPAVYKHQPVGVFFYGTVMFRNVDGKPRLRMFANQETSELEKESDFIGPQPVIGGESKFSGLHYQTEPDAVRVRAVVELLVAVTEAGDMSKMVVRREDPAGIGFDTVATDDFTGAKFIPAFRNGKAVASEVTLPLYYLPGNVISPVPLDGN